ncbi:sugar transferase [Clostridium sp. OM02-18AC]|uniref:exopolysaccharide biosynthesis polyprenyl glycosylphosphotransferase n=1 Tax=Clostridium sp. OM02-18AC TaxID=2292311 RepID=UPI000E482ABF|nr:exopolysaccharide biosynthesis polyprenyl glycosylphosphotransferase [Clostridium sp. OM02-18AC]RHV63251.1 sugar transferase [Clostridium sp. OM02-18AC]
MKIDEKYKRLIKLFFSMIMVLLITVLYHQFWVRYFNKVILYPFYRRGMWMMAGIYAGLLVFFMNTYGGFKIGYLRKWNLIYSQILSLACTDLFTYFQLSVLDKRMFDVKVVFVLFGVEIIVVVCWTMVFQLFYANAFPPRRMILISGDRSDYHLLEKINARDDKYIICETINYQENKNQIIKKINEYDSIIVGDIPSHERNKIIKYCFDKGIRTYSVPKISDILLKSSDELNLFDTPLLLSRNMGLTIEQQFMKRIIDIVGAILGMFITIPVFVIVWICIKLTDGGPVLYTQIRLTKDGRPFRIYKFRTMVQDAEKIGGAQLATDGDPRILPIGRLLRATRLDELPQVFNVIKGDMSLVGPRPERPELVKEIIKEIPEFPNRMKVKAGLTGYAQVYGKYNTTAYDKLKFDLMYIRKYSILLDLKLIIMTPKILLMKESTEGVKK